MHRKVIDGYYVPLRCGATGYTVYATEFLPLLYPVAPFLRSVGVLQDTAIDGATRANLADFLHTPFRSVPALITLPFTFFGHSTFCTLGK